MADRHCLGRTFSRTTQLSSLFKERERLSDRSAGIVQAFADPAEAREMVDLPNRQSTLSPILDEFPVA